jgi:hypothetical protein
MDGETPRRGGLNPLVPPPRRDRAADLLALQRHGLEMVTAANRLALSWMRDAAAQQVALTRRTLDEMAETARRVAIAEAPPGQAMAVLEMLDRARVLGIDTAQEIGALMSRMQGETVKLLDQALLPRDGDHHTPG